MPKKNHHFVPQFYLRNFSKNGRSISLVNIAQEKAIENASIAGQCYRRKFYGESDELEDILAEIEGYYAPIIKSIVNGNSVPRGSHVHFDMLQYLVIQYLRTRSEVELTARSMSLLSTHLGREYLSRRGENIGDARAIINPGIGASLSMTNDFAESMADLDVRVLQVACNARLITSGAPTIIYNEWCEGAPGRGVTGTLCRGLQLFLPLSPNCLLMLFDSEVYSVDEGTKGIISVKNPQDIYNLNKLQLVYAQENLFLPEWEDRDRILNALPQVKTMRQEYRVIVEIAESVEKDPSCQSTSTMVRQYTQMPNTHLKLKFSDVRRRASKMPMRERNNMYRHKNFPGLNREQRNIGTRLRRKEFLVKGREAWRDDWGNIVP